MSKQTTSFRCTNCTYQSVKWIGKCPECNEWNSFVENTPAPAAFAGAAVARGHELELRTLEQVPSTAYQRMVSGCSEWDRVMGGGIMRGSFIILTGDPGIGKSTLLLQIAQKLAHEHAVLYFSSEESLEQVKLRAQWVGSETDQLLFSDCAQLESIIETAQKRKPAVIVVDSIQNCYFADTQAVPGTVGQLREAGFRLMRLAKEHMIAVIVTGHITKEGYIAGPKTLEHMVDGVFYLQGEDRWHTRILRAVKNRFGSISEIGFFAMDEHGLQEVPNINEQLLQESSCAPGSALISYTEGSRPLLLELQALTIPSKLGVPQRVITGADHKHVVLIAAILEKYLQVKLSAHDLFFKVGGGFKIHESSADLGIALALLSSYFQQALPERSIALGEISLTGAIKPVNYIAAHLQEAKKFGLKKLFLAHGQQVPAHQNVVTFSHVYELLDLFRKDDA